MTKPLSIEKIGEIALENGYSLLSDEYKNQKTVIHLIDGYGYKYSSIASNFMITVAKKKNFLESFCPSNIYSIENFILWMKKNNKTCTYISGKYVKVTKMNMKMKCRCGNIFICSISDITKGNREFCLTCSKNSQLIGGRLSIEEVEQRFLNLGIKIIDENRIYIRRSDSFMVECIICGAIWRKDCTHFERGCPFCLMSKGEVKIENFLNKKGIKFEKQKKFSECKNILPLPFDFYLKDKKVLIEYNGKQHYEEMEFFGGIKSFLEQKKRDKIKVKYCKENNIPLLIIPYTEYERIEEIVSDFLEI